MLYLQNKVTGEIKDVEPDSQEFRDLIAERTSDNKPVWEQTSDAAVARKVQSAEAGVVATPDLPKDSQLVSQKNLVEGFGPEKEPWTSLTDAEVELGLTPKQKAAEEQATLDTNAQAANAQTTAEAASKIAASDTQRRGVSPVAADVPTGAEAADGTAAGTTADGSPTSAQGAGVDPATGAEGGV